MCLFVFLIKGRKEEKRGKLIFNIAPIFRGKKSIKSDLCGKIYHQEEKPQDLKSVMFEFLSFLRDVASHLKLLNIFFSIYTCRDTHYLFL